MNEEQQGPLHQRYAWFDQARGMVVLLLLAHLIVYQQRGSILGGDPILGPTALNHGYVYYRGYPAVITLADVGQPIFLVVMGFAAHLAFTSRLRKKGPAAAWFYGARRVALLYVCGFVDTVLLNMLQGRTASWTGFLYNGTFAKLGLGALAAYTALFCLRRADGRAILAVAMMAVHAILYAFPIFDHYDWMDNIAGLPTFPFGTMNLAALAIMGTAFAGWIRQDAAQPLVGFKARVLPATTIAFVLFYCMDWLQPAEHHDLPASLALLAVALSGTMLMGFYAADLVDLRFPLLCSFGKNLLLMFVLSFLIIEVWTSFFPKDYLLGAPYVTVLAIAIFPVVVLGALAVFLDRKNIVLRL